MTRLRILRPVSAVVGVIGLLMVATIGGSGTPTIYAVSDDEALEVALQESGFDDPAVEVMDAVASPDDPPVEQVGVSTPVRVDESYDGETDARDPGPDPPFDPAAPLMVSNDDGDPTAVHGRPLRVVLMGDSAAWTLGWELGDALDPGIDVSNRAVIGCGVMPPESQWGSDGDYEQYGPLCADQMEVETRGFSEGPDVVVVWLGAWEVFDHRLMDEDLLVFTARYEEVVEQRLQQRIDRAREIGVPAILTVVPCMGGTPESDNRLVRGDAARVGWVNDRIEEVAARNPGWVRMIDPTPHLCDDEGRPVQANGDGLQLRPDGVHFESDSAVWMWNSWMAGSLASAFLPAG